MISDCNLVPTIPTKDLALSRRFYEDVIGLRVRGEDPDMGVWYECGGSAVYLYETQFAGTAEHTLASLESEHVEEDIQELRDKGVRFETYDMPGIEWDGDVAIMQGQKGVWFRDPAGNILGMFQKSEVLARA